MTEMIMYCQIIGIVSWYLPDTEKSLKHFMDKYCKTLIRFFL